MSISTNYSSNSHHSPEPSCCEICEVFSGCFLGSVICGSATAATTAIATVIAVTPIIVAIALACLACAKITGNMHLINKQLFKHSVFCLIGGSAAMGGALGGCFGVMFGCGAGVGVERKKIRRR